MATKPRNVTTRDAPRLKSNLRRPPADANIPIPPVDFLPGVGGNLRGVKPRVSELATIDTALAELRGFNDWDAVFGKTVISRDILIDIFETASEWSSMRIVLEKWDVYCAFEERNSWQRMRGSMAPLRAVIDLAAATKPKLVERLPYLRMFLGTMSEAGHKAVASRRANQAAEAEGKPPVKGRRAKVAKKAALRQALAEAKGSKKVAK